MSGAVGLRIDLHIFWPARTPGHWTCAVAREILHSRLRRSEKPQAFRQLAAEVCLRRRLWGTDFVEPMLERADRKAREGGYAAAFSAADTLNLPFADASFDLVTTAFGFRNLANYENGVREICARTQAGRRSGIAEFTEPRTGPLAAVFRFYFRHILPRIGGAISGNSEAYAYLPGSVAKFPSPPELAALMEKTGFRDVRFASWNFGSVILHSGRRE